MTHMLYPIYFVIFIIQLTTCAPNVDNTHSLVLEEVLKDAHKPISFQMEDPVSPFLGRTSELSEIKWMLADKKMLVITGSRGVGKTELAKKFAQEFILDNTSNTIWIDAETHKSIIKDFKTIAPIIGLNVENKSVTAILRETFAHFDKNTLFIFDNAGNDNVIVNNLKTFIGTSKFINILVTSRSPTWSDKFSVFKLNSFTKEESIEYIKLALKDLKIPVTDEKSEELANHLENLPLALKKSTDHIIKQNTLFGVYTIDNYIMQLLGKEFPTTTTTERTPLPDDYEDIVEESIATKISEETARIGDQISGGATKAWDKVSDGATGAWEKVSDGASNVGQQVSQGAHQAAKEVARVSENVGHSVKKFFSGFG